MDMQTTLHFWFYINKCEILRCLMLLNNNHILQNIILFVFIKK